MRALELSTWPHGMRRALYWDIPHCGACQHSYGQVPAADGKVYLVCRLCGHVLGAVG